MYVAKGIDTLEPLLNQHRLVRDYSAIKKDIEYALSEPKGKASMRRVKSYQWFRLQALFYEACGRFIS